MDSLVYSLGYWGCSSHPKVWYDPPPLDLSCSMKNKWPKTISPVKTFDTGVNTIVQTSHQGPFHGKELPIKNIPRLGNIVHNLKHLPVDDAVKGGLINIILTTIVMDFLYNDTPYYQHELTQFSSKIFRHVHPCSVVHMSAACILHKNIWCDFYLPVYAPGLNWFTKMKMT